MISLTHFEEWSQQSAIDEEICKLNLISIEGNSPYDFLLYSDTVPRRNDGRIRSHVLKQYQHIEKGGWWASGIDLLTGYPDLWGCFKPNKPRRQHDNPGSRIKYEHPYRTPTGVFALRISKRIGLKIAQRYGLEESFATIPDNTDSDAWNKSFWDWAKDTPEIDLFLTEGIKKCAALLSQGYLAIGLPGINSGYRKDKLTDSRFLIPQLQILNLQRRQTYIAFDEDSKPATIRNVRRASNRLGRLLAGQGAIVSIVRWESALGKGCDDLIVNFGVKAFDRAVSRSLTLDISFARNYWDLTIKPDAEVDLRFLEALNIPANVKFVALKSPKGTGKTEVLTLEAQWALENNKRVIILTHRVQLGEALCARFGINYLSEIYSNSDGQFLGFGLCVDSLHKKSMAKFDADSWRDCVIFIDEVEQVLGHLLNSSTCAYERVQILKNFKKLITSAHRIYIADADLSDISIEYVQSLIGERPWLLLNSYKPANPWEIWRYPSPETLLDQLEAHIEDGGKPFVCLSAQKAKSPWGSKNLESYLKARFPDRKILRVDSESIAETDNEALGAVYKLNTLLPNYDVVLASPSIETGVSIDITDHFTSVWGIAQGLQSENVVRQALARVRVPIPRHIWAAKHGLAPMHQGHTSYRALMRSQNMILAAHLKLLQKVDWLEADQVTDPDELSNFQPETLRCWAKMVLRHNAGQIQYDQLLFSNLIAEGHILKEFEPPDDDEREEKTKELIQQFKDTGYLQEREKISASPILANEDDYKLLKDKRSKTEAERFSQRRWEVSQRYGDCNEQLLLLDDQGGHQRLRLQYYLGIGNEFLAERDKKIALSQYQQGEGALFAPDFNRSQLGLKIYALQKLQILPLIQDKGRVFKNSDEDMVQLHKNMMQPLTRWQLRALGLVSLNLTDTPIQAFKKLLKKLAIKLVRMGRESQEGTRHWLYQIESHELQPAIFDFWFRQDSVRATEKAKPKLSTSGNKSVEDRNRDLSASVIEELLAIKPERLQSLASAFVRAKWWAQVRDSVWMAVPVAIRQLLDRVEAAF